MNKKEISVARKKVVVQMAMDDGEISPLANTPLSSGMTNRDNMMSNYRSFSVVHVSSHIEDFRTFALEYT